MQEKVGKSPRHPKTIDGYLAAIPNGRVNWIARTLGFLTTPFKNLGIFGWADIYPRAEIIGCVVQQALSTDRLQTLDIRVRSFAVAGEEVRPTQPRFIRAEMCRVTHQERTPAPMSTDRQVKIAGKLVWDGDGFFEIHPGLCGSVEVLDLPCLPPA